MKLGLIGERLGHSWSPWIHTELLLMQGVEGTYELIELTPDKVKDIPDRMRQENITGLNVTIPYKEALLSGLDELSDEVLKIGALNTIFLKNGKTYGYNTDYYGVLYMFEEAGLELRGKDVTLLGGGGASRAAIYAILKAGAASLTVAVRNVEKAEKALRKYFPEIRIQGLSALPGGDILFNTTPVGMYPAAGVSVAPAEEIQKYKAAADMVYNPMKTEFLRLAAENGLQCVSGIAMLVGQAIRAEEIWLSAGISEEDGKAVLESLKNKLSEMV